MNIRENLESALRSIPGKVQLIAVSKKQNHETIMEAYSAGQRLFGENKVQELVAKASSLPSDIQWHFIGHLQTNKVKFIVPLTPREKKTFSYDLTTRFGLNGTR